ncbi:FimB/Mfa2 family fimbrial subunit [Bacteroides stercorirosoris]|jgi:hypothetical protein|uniref:FimB/Mfa2 family fimbrial subunit n=1 Tax=Bacteroides stercorirosoris TaxID=871324 RepID=UPI000A45D5F3
MKTNPIYKTFASGSILLRGNILLRRSTLLPGNILLLGSLLLLASCVKDDLHNTPHPDRGALLVTTDWSTRSSSAPLPDQYILRIGDTEQTVSGETNPFAALLLPGNQHLLAYNQPDGITLNGTVATVNTLPDGTLTPTPSYLFSATRELEIIPDDTLRVTVTMQQRIRQLTLILKLSPGDENRLSRLSATLTGILPAIHLADGSPASDSGKSIIPPFTLTDSDASGTRRHATRAATRSSALSATVRLPGVMPGETQLLTLSLTLSDGHTQTLTTDLTEALRNFGNAPEPLTLDAALQLPTPTGIGGSITDWNVVDNGEVDIH